MSMQSSPGEPELSVFDLFRIGIGPSSSHTVGPMHAARRFVLRQRDSGRLEQIARIRVALYGSLGATGRGHGTDKAILLGLSGHEPHTVAVEDIEPLITRIRGTACLVLAGGHAVDFKEGRDLVFCPIESLPGHPNALRLSCFDQQGGLIDRRIYYSIGGGFIVEDVGNGNSNGCLPAGQDRIRDGATGSPMARPLPLPFESGGDLLALAEHFECSIAEIVRRNEASRADDMAVTNGLLEIEAVMQACIARGCQTEGLLPGGLAVRRRAPGLHRQLVAGDGSAGTVLAQSGDPLKVIDWINLFALAVNEENAAGGRVVTAPTNGAAGIIPAVLGYYRHFVAGANDDGVVDFLLTAGAIGMLYKKNASISGAEVGCQGEVGVACSMAAAGLCAVLGGSPRQVENAAEIGMEHHLGMTCDPVGGLVQIPCIERNAIGSVKAINAARMALRGDGRHRVSLDEVIKTMRETGADMQAKYKETALGGLAVNVVKC